MQTTLQQSEKKRTYTPEQLTANRERSRAWYRANRERQKVYNKAYREKNLDEIRKKDRERYITQPRKRKSHQLMYEYGITLAEHDALFALQNNVCAICKSETSGSKHSFHVDHCHDSGVVRGILCHGCNIMLGAARDNPEILKAAVTYLSNDFEKQEWRLNESIH